MNRTIKLILVTLIIVITGLLFYIKKVRGVGVKTTVSVPVNYEVNVQKYDIYINTNARRVFVNKVQVSF